MGYGYKNTNLNGLADVSDFMSMDAQMSDPSPPVDVSQFYQMDVADIIEPTAVDTMPDENPHDVLLQRAADAYAAGDTNARDIILARPSTVTAPDSSASNFFDTIIKNLPAVAREFMTYKKESLPGGGAIYNKIDPRTGKPLRDAGSFTLGGANTGKIIMYGALALGAMMLISSRRRK